MKKENGVLKGPMTNRDLRLLKKNPEVFWRGVSRIGSYAFKGCEFLETITIPSSVTKIEFYAFADCTSLRSVEIKEGVKEIGYWAFNNCIDLQSITIPSSVEEIGDEAFLFCTSLKSVEIKEGVTQIGAGAFSGCTSLPSITIPSSVTRIIACAFSDCTSLKTIVIEDAEGKKHEVKADANVFEAMYGDMNALRDFVVAKDKLKKTFVPAGQVVANTSKDMIENFYRYSKNWGKLLGDYAKSVGKSPSEIMDEPKADFYKLCLISGVFSDDATKRERGVKFIEEKIIGKFDEQKLHENFTGLNTRENGCNSEFEDFLNKYFDDICNQDTNKNDLVAIYNFFKDIQKAYPNKRVLTNTENDKLTPEIVRSYIKAIKYHNVTNETAELADLCSQYGYSQNEFDEVSQWFVQGKQIKEGGEQKLLCKPDSVTKKDVVTYEFLEKDNPLGVVLGDITNCCQRVSDAGESCCRHGMTDPCGGFVVFRKDGKIVGQSWVWYNKELGKVCLDNVEVPRSVKLSVMSESAGFIDCVRRVKDGILDAMKDCKPPVKYATMGKGYNDILETARKKFPDISSCVLGSASICSGGAPAHIYTDTKAGELVIK